MRMLNLFGGSKGDHPLADLKDARRVITELPSDPSTALAELTHWLESVSAEPTFKPDHRAMVVQMLDEAAQAHARKLSREYVSSPRMTKAQEVRLWEILYAFWKEDALALSAPVEAAAAGAKGAEGLKGLLPMLAVRSLRAVAQQMKWRYVRYGLPQDEVWATVNRMYSAVEARKIAQSRVKPYAGVPSESSPEQEFVRIVMFVACSPNSLPPLEIELAERLIAQFAPLFAFSTQLLPDMAYWLDLGGAQGPVRMQSAPQQSSAGLRFFGAGSALEEIERLMETIRATHQVPTDINLGGSYAPEAVLHVLEHLNTYWSPQVAERRHARHQVKARVAVWGGFERVVDALSPGESLTFDDTAPETWLIEDVSSGGFAAFVSEVKGDWLRIGCLLALRPEGGDNWLLGSVRRLSRPTLQEAEVAIKTLARTAISVSLRIELGTSRALDTQMGILLNPDPTAQELDVIVHDGLHLPGQKLVLELDGERTMLLALARTERGPDYEILRCRRVSSDAST
jgi:hypothetical protein